MDVCRKARRAIVLRQNVGGLHMMESNTAKAMQMKPNTSFDPFSTVFACAQSYFHPFKVLF